MLKVNRPEILDVEAGIDFQEDDGGIRIDVQEGGGWIDFQADDGGWIEFRNSENPWWQGLEILKSANLQCQICRLQKFRWCDSSLSFLCFECGEPTHSIV